MNLEHADHIYKILRDKGYDTKTYTRKNGGYVVAVFAAEGMDRMIRNEVPLFWWFWYWLHATTVHEPDDKIIVEFE